MTPYEELTGNTVSFATVDLVARVKGFLTAIKYVDGALVKQNDVLFEIEQTMYKANVKEAEAQFEAAQAELVQSQAEYVRQETLLRQNVSAQTTFDKAKAKRDSDPPMSKCRGQPHHPADQSGLHHGDGAVQRRGDQHLVSVSQLVGDTTATKLATIVQMD